MSLYSIYFCFGMNKSKSTQMDRIHWNSRILQIPAGISGGMKSIVLICCHSCEFWVHFTSRAFTYLILFILLCLSSFLGTASSSDLIICRLFERPQLPPFLEDIRKEIGRCCLVGLGISEGRKAFLEPFLLWWGSPFVTRHGCRCSSRLVVL